MEGPSDSDRSGRTPWQSWNVLDDVKFMQEKRASMMSKAEGKGESNTPVEPVAALIPGEPTVAEHEAHECKICKRYVGDRVCLPCGHYPVCTSCLNKKIKHAAKWKRSVQCPAPGCFRRVVEHPTFQDASHPDVG